MNYRKMTAGDYEGVYALWLSCAGMGLNNVDDSKEGIAKFLDRNPDTCLVSEDGGRVIGVIMAGNDGRRGYIYHTAVHPDYRNRGIATRLADMAVSELRRLGITKVGLFAFERNESGNAFWESRGFTRRDDLVYRNRELTELVTIET